MFAKVLAKTEKNLDENFPFVLMPFIRPKLYFLARISNVFKWVLLQNILKAQNRIFHRKIVQFEGLDFKLLTGPAKKR